MIKYIKHITVTQTREVPTVSSPIGSKNNVKIFVLYLLDNINYPLDFCTINDIVMQTDYVMYMDFAEAFIEMVDGDLISSFESEGVTYYEVTAKGRCVAVELKSDILPSILDQALTAALRYLDFSRRAIVTSCRIEKKDDGKFEVICEITEKKELIFSTHLTVDSEDRAKRMKAYFNDRPEVIYRGVTALLAGQMNYLF